MKRIVQITYIRVLAVNGQKILNQVIRTDRNEVQTLEELLQAKRGRRHFHHAADLDVFSVFDSAILEFFLSAAHVAENDVGFGHPGEHGDQQADAAGRAGAQNRAQLREEHVGVAQAESDGASAE